MLISRAIGRGLKLKWTLRDIEERNDYFRLYLIEDDAEKTRFNYEYT